MKKWIVTLLFLMPCVVTAFAAPHYTVEYLLSWNRIHITVINKTGQEGYFVLCSDHVSPETKTVCGTPVKLKKTATSTFFPAFPNAYPTFVLASNEKALTCATAKNPQAQKSFRGNTQNHYTVTFNKLLNDQNGNPAAVSCTIED